MREVLELGSGGGNNASHMKRTFGMTLVEPADGMREKSRRLNPECAHLKGDMRHLRLGCTFDAVFLHDAVMYMTAEDDLRAALETVAVHLAPGGAALVAPDATKKLFIETTEHGGGEDECERRGRYLEWTLPPEHGESTYTVHYAFMLCDVEIETFMSKSEELCSEFSAEIETRGYHRVRCSMEKHLSKKLRPLKTDAEAGLQAELGKPRRPIWRERFSARSG